MTETTELAGRIAAELDDVLATTWLVRENDPLLAHLFGRLVGLLLEGILVELRRRLLDGELTAGEYAAELVALAGQARRAGLLDASTSSRT